MNFKTYSTYEIEDFLEEEAFRSWVQAPTKFTDQYWKEFLVLHPEQAQKITEARQLLLSMETYFEVAEEDTTELDESFIGDLKVAMHTEQQREQKVAKRAFLRRRWEIAATVLLLITTSVGVWKVAFNPTFPSHHVADYGEWKTIELPDGSTVHLNANSTLHLAKNWDKVANRRVRLEGEAYFEVAKKPATNAKFLVTTTDLTIEVLGTQFNVNTKSENTEVFLEEGKIKLDLGATDAMMTPGDFIAYSKTNKKIIETKKIKTDLPGAWRSGMLSIKEKTIGEKAEKIEEIYGIQVVIEKKVLENEIRTIPVPIDRLELAIPILETTLKASIERKDNQLIIK
ncbi:MAG: FecR family protein [Saprospiraceae bacterium]